MSDQSVNSPEIYDSTYFSRAAYEGVSFRRFSQYWWSNRFYALLAQKYGAREGNVLEVGCGMGDLLAWFPHAYRTYGVDVNLWALLLARKNVPQAQFLRLLAEDLDIFPESYFQIVIAKHIVEHLHDPFAVIGKVSRLLKPGGLLLMATPNLDSPMRRLKKQNWIGYRDPTHISLKQPSEWLDMLKFCGLVPFRVFSDGFWDAPYLPLLPKVIQKLLFGAPGGLQAIFVWSIIPVYMGESLIVLARK
ncbi:MAG: class I SAM-dependent methyltransferase [Anaerolineae bacterium]|nr:class I SAM-dependent methyltransferase [Anaerolineae bacterium]